MKHESEVPVREDQNKWFWMANFCKKEGIPPHQEWAWILAETAYTKHRSREDQKLAIEKS